MTPSDTDGACLAVHVYIRVYIYYFYYVRFKTAQPFSFQASGTGVLRCLHTAPPAAQLLLLSVHPGARGAGPPGVYQNYKSRDRSVKQLSHCERRILERPSGTARRALLRGRNRPQRKGNAGLPEEGLVPPAQQRHAAVARC